MNIKQQNQLEFVNSIINKKKATAAYVLNIPQLRRY